MNMQKRILSVVAVVLCTAAAVLYGTGEVRPAGQTQAANNSANSAGGLFAPKKETIYFWYTDDNLTSFLNSAAVSFGEQRGVRVIPVLTSEGEYLEAINHATLHTEQMPGNLTLKEGDL